MLLRRISVRGSSQMPPIASSVLDTNAIKLVSDWIVQGLAGFQTFTDWQLARFGSTTDPNAAAEADPDNDTASNLLEYLVGTDPLAAGDRWQIRARPSDGTVEISFLQIANRGFQVEWASSLSPPTRWEPLDVPANQPLFSATNFSAAVSDTLTDSPFRFYRVRVFEP
jgi:hypothetical protein